MDMVKDGVSRVAIDALDYTVARAGMAIGDNAGGTRLRELIHLGQTTATNAQLVDNEGRGLLADLWKDPAEDFNGRYTPGKADCMRFMQKVALKIIPGAAQIKTAFDRVTALYEANNRYVNLRYAGPDIMASSSSDVPLRYRTVVDDTPVMEAQSWNIKDPKNPEVDIARATYDTSADLPDEASLPGSKEEPLATIKEEQLAKAAPIETNARAGARASGACRRSVTDRRCVAADEVPSEPVGTTGVKTAALARSKGVVSVIRTVTAEAAQALGIASAAAGVAFVILDLVNGEWTLGALAAVGTFSPCMHGNEC